MSIEVLYPQKTFMPPNKFVATPIVSFTDWSFVFMYFTNFCNAFPVRCRIGRAYNNVPPLILVTTTYYCTHIV